MPRSGYLKQAEIQTSVRQTTNLLQYLNGAMAPIIWQFGVRPWSISVAANLTLRETQCATRAAVRSSDTERRALVALASAATRVKVNAHLVPFVIRPITAIVTSSSVSPARPRYNLSLATRQCDCTTAGPTHTASKAAPRDFRATL